MYIPIYSFDGNFSAIMLVGENASIPICEDNRHYRNFVTWLAEQGKTIEQWLSENPWQPYATLDEHKIAKGNELDQKISAMGLEHYPLVRQNQLMALLMEAMVMSYPNRIAYIQSAIAWQKLLAAEFFRLKAEILAATSHEQINAVSWDSTAFLTSHPDPLVTIEQAGSITN